MTLKKWKKLSEEWRPDIRTDLGWIAESLKKAGFRGKVPGDIRINGVSIDSRGECAGTLFVAIEGENADGHDYLSDAVEGGAGALLCDREKVDKIGGIPRDVPIFPVPDTVKAMQHLAKCWREKVEPKVIGITGSTGKTGTKELAASVLSAYFRVHSTKGNLNNHIGVPLTLLSMPEDTEVLIVEMGANHKEEIRLLSSIAGPGIGIITNIGPAHLEYFGSLKGVARAKAELLKELDREGTAVLPADDEFAPFLKSRSRAKVVTFGITKGADYRVEDVRKKDVPGYEFTLAGVQMETCRYGKHHMLNVAAVVAAASQLGITPVQSAPLIAMKGEVTGRGNVYSIKGIIFVDDSYNSNPASLCSAVDAFMEMPVEGKRWVVLGDMLELGDMSMDLHKEMGVLCGKAGIDGLLTLGNCTVELNRAAAVQRKAPENISHFLEIEKLVIYLDSFLGEGDCVLVKGSRSMGMEKVIEGVEARRNAVKRRVC